MGIANELSQVRGLAQVVGSLEPSRQAASLSFCLENCIPHVGMIHWCGHVEQFLSAINIRPFTIAARYIRGALATVASTCAEQAAAATVPCMWGMVATPSLPMQQRAAPLSPTPRFVVAAPANTPQYESVMNYIPPAQALQNFSPPSSPVGVTWVAMGGPPQFSLQDRWMPARGEFGRLEGQPRIGVDSHGTDVASELCATPATIGRVGKGRRCRRGKRGGGATHANLGIHRSHRRMKLRTSKTGPYLCAVTISPRTTSPQDRHGLHGATSFI
eukprot:scaffold169193_cov35-Tisochrysis_lutea.AAC.1